MTLLPGLHIPQRYSIVTLKGLQQVSRDTVTRVTHSTTFSEKDLSAKHFIAKFNKVTTILVEKLL